MPVTFDNGLATQSTGTACQFNFTVGTNAVLLAYIASNGGAGVSVSAVAYGGQALTRLVRVAGLGGAGNWPMEIWGLTAPASGSNVLSAQFVQSDLWYINAISYLNVTTVNPFGTPASATATNTSVCNLSFSSTTTDLVSFGITGAQVITIGNGTQRVADPTNTFKLGDAAGAGPTKSVSASFAAANAWIACGVSLRFSAVAVSNLRFFRALTGAGY